MTLMCVVEKKAWIGEQSIIGTYEGDENSQCQIYP